MQQGDEDSSPNHQELTALAKISLPTYKAQHCVFKPRIRTNDSAQNEWHTQVSTKPSQRYMTWSDKNMFVVSLPEPEYDQLSDTYTYPFLIIDPNSPKEHTLVQTQHKSPIINHSWTPLQNFNLLLTTDADSTVCLWKCKSNVVNDMACIQQLQIENVVTVKWLFSERRFTNKEQPDEDDKNIFGKYQLLSTRVKALISSTVAFVAVLRTGHIQLHFLDNISQKWFNSSACLNVEISKADISVTAEGNIVVGYTQQLPTYTVHIHEFALTRIKGDIFQMPSACASSFNVAELDQLYAVEDESTITDFKFVPFSSSDLELIVIICDNGNNSVMQKWRFTMQQIRSFLGSTIERKIWRRLTTISNINNDFPPLSRVNYVISCMEFCRDASWVVFGYLSGKIEIRRVKDLTVVSETTIQPTWHASSGSEENVYKRLRGDTAFPIGVAVSPNNCLISVLDFDYNIHLYYVPSTKETVEIESNTFKQLWELCIINAMDNWDILLCLKKLVDWDKETTVSTMRSQLQLSAPKWHESQKRFLSLKLDKVDILFARLSNETEQQVQRIILLKFRRYFQTITEMLRSLHSFNLHSLIGDFKDRQKIFLKLESMDLDGEQISSLVPLCNWFIDMGSLMYTMLDKHSSAQEKVPLNLLFSCLPNQMILNVTLETLCVSLVVYHNYNKKEIALDDPLTLKKLHLELLIGFYMDIYEFVTTDAKTKKDLEMFFKAPRIKDILQTAQPLRAVITRDVQTLLRDMDFTCNPVGLLSTSWKSSLFSQDESHIARDVVTRQKISLMEPHKICKTCNSVASLHQKSFAHRWLLCCPQCEGYWKLSYPRKIAPQ